MAKQKSGLSDMVTKALENYNSDMGLDGPPAMSIGRYQPFNGKRTRAEKKLYALHQLDMAKAQLRRTYAEIRRGG